jgi:hypothetical protein
MIALSETFERVNHPMRQNASLYPASGAEGAGAGQASVRVANFL